MNKDQICYHTVMLIIIVQFSFSCLRDNNDNNYLADMLRAFQNERINIAGSWLLIEGTTKRICSIDTILPPLVFYYGPEDCSDCAIAHLRDKTPLLKMSEKEGTFQVVFLFSPKPDDVKSIIEKISQLQPDYPVYIDVDGNINHEIIPSDVRFHTFLLDQDRHPYMVGNPLSSEKMMNVFRRAVSTHNDLKP